MRSRLHGRLSGPLPERSEGIPLSDRERAEGFLRYIVTVAYTYQPILDDERERGEGFLHYVASTNRPSDQDQID